MILQLESDGLGKFKVMRGGDVVCSLRGTEAQCQEWVTAASKIIVMLEKLGSKDAQVVMYIVDSVIPAF